MIRRPGRAGDLSRNLALCSVLPFAARIRWAAMLVALDDALDELSFE